MTDDADAAKKDDEAVDDEAEKADEGGDDDAVMDDEAVAADAMLDEELEKAWYRGGGRTTRKGGGGGRTRRRGGGGGRTRRRRRRHPPEKKEKKWWQTPRGKDKGPQSVEQARRPGGAAEVDVDASRYRFAPISGAAVHRRPNMYSIVLFKLARRNARQCF